MTASWTRKAEKEFAVRIQTLVLVVMTSALAFGCRSPRGAYLATRQGEVSLPLWFTSPAGAEQSDVPASMGMVLPDQLKPLAEEYGLPGWAVYGVVRSLGSEEFLVNGVVRTFTVRDELGESRVVVDDVYYDVDPTRAEAILAGIARNCAAAETELDRHHALGRFVIERHGSFVLFSLARAVPLSETGDKAFENLLLTSGEGRAPVETFEPGDTDGFPQIGWEETGTHYVSTMAGRFQYARPIRSFRRVEEDAIKDLAKGLVVKFSHMRKGYEDSQVEETGGIREETFREEIRLRMRGVRVTRRVVDLDRCLCLVVVRVPKDGVARR